MVRSKDNPLSVVREELRAAGVPFREEPGRHVKVWFTVAGKEHCYVCSANRVCHNRSMRNTRAGIRRMLRQLGALAPDPGRG